MSKKNRDETRTYMLRDVPAEHIRAFRQRCRDAHCNANAVLRLVIQHVSPIYMPNVPAVILSANFEVPVFEPESHDVSCAIQRCAGTPCRSRWSPDKTAMCVHSRPACDCHLGRSYTHFNGVPRGGAYQFACGTAPPDPPRDMDQEAATLANAQAGKYPPYARADWIPIEPSRADITNVIEHMQYVLDHEKDYPMCTVLMHWITKLGGSPRV